MTGKRNGRVMPAANSERRDLNMELRSSGRGLVQTRTTGSTLSCLWPSDRTTLGIACDDAP